MTYKLNNPALEKINSPIILLFPDGSQKNYDLGTDLVNDSFNSYYIISEIVAKNNVILLRLEITESLYNSWTGEEQTFF